MTENFTFNTSEKIRLDEFLRRELPGAVEGEHLPSKSSGAGEGERSGGSSTSEGGLSNGKIRRLIVAGAVSVNGRQINRPAFELRGRSNVVVQFDKEKFFYEKQPDDIAFSLFEKDVLYEDDNLIFVNKPAFFPVEQTIVGNRDNLHDAVVKYLWDKKPELRNPPYVGIMHRLDRETSGVIMFTKNRAINKAVSDMFQGHNFKKLYTAVVCPTGKGNIPGGKAKLPGGKPLAVGTSFTVEKFMGRISPKGQAGKWGSLPESRGGQHSKTKFKIIGEKEIAGRKCFVVDCDLETGRTHQIRVHLSEAGLPIVGDTLYGGIKGERIMLHARALEIHNKDVGVDGVIEAPVPF